MAFTNMDADAFMMAHMDDNEDAYASAVESKIAEHEAWSSPLIDLILNHECPVTSCLLKAVKTGGNALEWAARNDADAFENILGLMSFGISNAIPEVALAFASVRKDLFTAPLSVLIESNDDAVAGAIAVMMERDITLATIAEAEHVDVENLNRSQLSAATFMSIMGSFVMQAGVHA